MHEVLGIDIGGSALKAAPVDTRSGRPLAPTRRFPTTERLSRTAMRDALGSLCRDFAWTGPVGIGFPGVVRGGRILTAPNLHPELIGLDVHELLPTALAPGPVALLNDADAAGLAEVRFGAARDCDGVVLVLVFGTGIGSALFHKGRLHPNTEFGHLPRDGRSWETFVSGAAKVRRGLDDTAWCAELDDYLGLLDVLLTPDLYVMGGGLSADFHVFGHKLKTRTQVKPALLLNEAGLVGAALYAATNAKGP